jgi:hypothetical protein
MNLKTTSLKQLLFICGLTVSLLFLTDKVAFANAKPYKNYTLNENGEEEEKKPAKKAKAAKTKNAGFTSLNNKMVKIYPDIIKREMHVVAKADNFDFFVFDIEGKIVANFKMKEKSHEKITGLARGKYTFRAFSGDEEMAAGKFEIR